MSIEQAMNVCQTTVVEDAWARGQELTVHGVIYGLHDGLLRDLCGQRVRARPGGADVDVSRARAAAT